VAGLRAAHGTGVIHRDLKPSNVKFTPDGNVKLVDFGIAKLLRTLDPDDSLPDVSRIGTVVGTVAYMSPEQARGKPIDARTDIWAFGCVLYEILTGRPAFRGDSPTDIIVKIATEEPDWNQIPKLPSGSEDIEDLVRKCLQKDPNLRFSSVAEIAGYLEAIGKDSRERRLSVPAPGRTSAGSDFVLPRRPAMPLFMLTQVGYLALYGAAMVQYDEVNQILARDFLVPAKVALVAPLILAMCGIAIRIYLISAVGWGHPEAGRKFTLLFPFLLIFDGIWAAAPLLMWEHLGLGLAFVCVALLAYVPFGYRTLMHAMYPPHRL
jgi:hypothetical protein